MNISIVFIVPVNVRKAIVSSIHINSKNIIRLVVNNLLLSFNTILPNTNTPIRIIKLEMYPLIVVCHIFPQLFLFTTR